MPLVFLKDSLLPFTVIATLCAQTPPGRLQQRNKSGLYMVIEPCGIYSACDYSNQARWIEGNGALPEDPYRMPEGWVEEFSNPLEAIDWLLGASLDELRGEEQNAEAV